MAPRGGGWIPSTRDSHKGQRNGNGNGYPWETFAAPPFSCRSKLFCCSVAESNPAHLPRSFVNPGRHLMNLQLRTFLECADNAEHTFSKCEVSHIVEVTARALHNPAIPTRLAVQEQWNIPSAIASGFTVDTNTPPLEEDEQDGMMVDHGEPESSELPFSTYQSMSTRYFVTQNSSNAWQAPPHSRQYRETHAEATQGRPGNEKYMEIPPFKTLPYTSESNSAGAGARTWIPSCSMLMWCNQHNTFYEVHVLS
ncbi:hypothetical protein A1O1_05558 [Capronia coronata CBS 617.96]|uniref:Uncharacterized protein n=1 Tax=Capronia coronata CBS 617.96 TaxID=1182541 RepID=W9Y7W8_9EURO|nr:uncharacterized protein A1O1_05558 [Capronia coronata CBS 617.96]EXJ88628.1 hypothetical protein A1O1_05558 [Capronia coronata CBS 617.96]